MDTPVRIQTPLLEYGVMQLKVGDRVLLSGPVFTARDAAHKRLIELIRQGKELPFDLRGSVIYYVGPAPPKPGMALGSAGPTSSYRMDPYTPALLDRGLKGMIGKGQRGPEVVQSIQTNKAVYFAATGGAGALLSMAIKASQTIAYDDLGPEAIRRLTVVDLPVIVVNDCHGNDLYTQGRRQFEITA
ncbi:MAG: Fe-S-containing hydro-lyase [Desulfobacterales bacterium]|jgi:fumarate hydratase subunit beta|nr:Fe-S-containing hydro-lyase [Desulfobacterales bacterium]